MKDFLKSLSNKIKKSYYLMITALVIAFFLWIICMNFADPITYENYVLELKFLNEDVLTENRKLIENHRELEMMTISVHVSGLKSELDKLVRNKTIFAYIDLNSSNLIYAPRIGETVPVNIMIGFGDGVNPENYNITSVSPQKADVMMDNYEDRSMRLVLNYIGETAPGYVARQAVSDVNTIIVSGASSVISKIMYLAADIDISDASADVEVISEVKAFDAFGNQITGQTMSVDEVNIKVPVWKTGYIYVAKPEYAGESDNGYVITSVSMSRDSVEVVGPAEDIDNLRVITLDAIDTAGIEGDIELSYDITNYLAVMNVEYGTSVELADSADRDIIVTIHVEQEIIKELRIPIRNISITGYENNRVYNLENDFVRVNIKGVASDLDYVSSLYGSVDVMGLSDGFHSLPVLFWVPDGVTIIDPPINVDVLISSYSAPNSEDEDTNDEIDAGESEGNRG